MGIEDKIEQDSELLERWKKMNPSIITDGVVSWEDYIKSNPKILFVLKEVNSDESNWDLREFIRDGARNYTWNNITRWIIGIRNINQNYNWQEIEKISEQERKEVLKSIAAINLKKETGGGAVADNDTVYKHAINDKDFLKEQVVIYDPELIICCGTSYAFFDSVYNGRDVKWEITSNGVWYVRDNNKVIISYNHPEARVSPNFLYYPLIDVLREIYGLHG